MSRRVGYVVVEFGLTTRVTGSEIYWVRETAEDERDRAEKAAVDAGRPEDFRVAEVVLVDGA